MNQPVYPAWSGLARSRWLGLGLLALGTLSSGIYAHAPLAAFAAVSGLALDRRRALAIALLVWLGNQAVGFGVRGYPLSAVAFTWGAMMGLATALVTVAVGLRPRATWRSWVAQGWWSAIATLASFVIYQGLILLAFPFLADGHTMGWEVVGALLQKHLLWAGAMVLGYNLLLWRHWRGVAWL